MQKRRQKPAESLLLHDLRYLLIYSTEYWVLSTEYCFIINSFSIKTLSIKYQDLELANRAADLSADRLVSRLLALCCTCGNRLLRRFTPRSDEIWLLIRLSTYCRFLIPNLPDSRATSPIHVIANERSEWSNLVLIRAFLTVFFILSLFSTDYKSIF